MSAPSPWLPVSPCTPACLPVPDVRTAGERALRAVRGAVRATLVATVMVVGAVAALLAPLLGPARLLAVQRRWALTLLAAAGVRLRVTHPERTAPTGGALLVANHVSWIDVLALYAVAPVRLLAKREVRAWPLVGAMAARAGTVFLDRDRLRELPDAVAGLAAAVRSGGTIGVFPEGTTHCGRALGSFRPAAFQAAIDGGVAVVPVAVRYDDGAAAFVGDDTLVSSLRRVLTGPGVVLTLDVLEPEEPGEPGHGAGLAVAAARRRELARRCRQVIATSLAGSGPVPGAVPDVVTEPVMASVSLPQREQEDEEVFDRVA